MSTSQTEQQALQDEISRLETQLQDAKSRLRKCNGIANDGNVKISELDGKDDEHVKDFAAVNGAKTSSLDPNFNAFTTLTPFPATLHTLLLLSDSSLPLGSFAFSSGLESYLAHHPSRTASQVVLFHRFLDLSLNSLASTALPYVLAGHRDPERLEELDNDFDASTVCNVARRASVAQGRALLTVYERAFRSQYKPGGGGDKKAGKAVDALREFSAMLRNAGKSNNPYPPSAHYAPLWGTITLALGIPQHSSAYLFLFSHARTVVSAAVRASVFGPYQAQGVLASGSLKEKIEELVKEYWEWKSEEAGQCVPVVDLWVGRHELLYSRIFNS